MTSPSFSTQPTPPVDYSDRDTTVSTNIAGVSVVTSTPVGPGGSTPTDGSLAEAQSVAEQAMGLSDTRAGHPGTPEPRSAPRSVAPGTPPPAPPRSDVRNPGETAHNPGGSYR